jgi:hypothetical protein
LKRTHGTPIEAHDAFSSAVHTSHEYVVTPNAERGATLPAIWRRSRRCWLYSSERHAHASGATDENIHHPDFRGQCLRWNEWKPDSNTDQKRKRAPALGPEKPGDKNENESGSHQDERRCGSGDEPPAWQAYFGYARPLSSRSLSCLVEIARQAKRFAVFLRDRVDGSAKGARNGCRIEHWEGCVARSALKRRDHYVFSKAKATRVVNAILSVRKLDQERCQL